VGGYEKIGFLCNKFGAMAHWWKRKGKYMVLESTTTIIEITIRNVDLDRLFDMIIGDVIVWKMI
jgi:hypothetical protein